MLLIPSKSRIPQTKARINWGHPISRLLKDCFLFDGAHVALNLAAPGHDAAVIGTTTTSSVTADGPAVKLPGDVNPPTNYMQSPHYRNMASGDVTVRIRFVPISQDGTLNLKTLVSKVSADGLTLELVIAINGQGAAAFGAFGNSGGSYAPALGNFSVGSVHDYVTTRTVSTGAVNVYQNGAFLGTASVSSTGTTGVTTPLQFDVDGSSQGFASPPCHFIAFQAWDRVLSSSEILQLWNEPQCFLQRPRRIMRAPIAGGGFTAKFRRTLSPMGTHVGGRQRQGWAA